MFIDRWAGALARSRIVAHIATVAAALFITIASLGLSPAVLAHGGHDPDAPTAVLPTAVQARAVAVGDEIEAVAILRGDDLLIYVDRFADNSPVTKATVIVTIGRSEHRAEINGDGIYLVKAPTLVRPGANELVIAVQDAAFSDLLIATLTTLVSPEAATITADPTGFLARLKSWVDVVGPTLTAILGSLAIMGFTAVLLLRRKPPKDEFAQKMRTDEDDKPRGGGGGPLVVLTLIGLLAIGGRDPAAAHGGHDHGDDAAQPMTVSGDAPRRLADGSVFLPKPTQRLLGVRTVQAQETSTRPSYTLVGRIIPNPDKSGVVQSTVNGRLTPPATGLPRLGQDVKAGDVLAYVTPAFLAIDSTNVAQTAGDLDQQIELAKTKLARGQRLLAANAGTRVTVEEAELLLRGLERRRAALGQSQIKSEPLLSPVDGVIASAKVMVGQVVAPQDILFEIIDPASLLVEAFVFDPAAPQKFDAASAQAQDGASFGLTFIGRSRALRQQSTILHFAIQNPPATLNVGLPVTVHAQAGDPVVGLLIPKAALVRGANGEDIVWRHTEPERFVATAVKVSSFDGERVLVQSGLKPSERVVVLGAELINQVR